MAGKNTAAFGIYTTRAGVENAVDALRAEGFRNTDISVLFPYNEGTKDFAHKKGTKAPEGAAPARERWLAGHSAGWQVSGQLAGLSKARVAEERSARTPDAYCCGLLPVVGRIGVPITSPETTNSTRRFCCRPAAVSLVATGWDSPNPRAAIEELLMPS
jgi:hypothetical protein